MNALQSPRRAIMPHDLAGSRADVTGFYDPLTGSVQYILADPATRRCAVIDPVLDFDAKSGMACTSSADWLLSHIVAHDLTLEWILETHPHADHLSAAGYLRDRTGAPTAIGERVTGVQTVWKEYYNLPAEFRTDGSQWNRLLADGDRVEIGCLDVSVMLSPGHSPCAVSYVIPGAVFVHDTVFMPDSGTARADLPGGNPRRLWRSIQQILQLPTDTILYTGHDYETNGRRPLWQSTVGQQKDYNAHVHDMDEESFVAMRSARDRTLERPKLMLAAMQVNISGGSLPAPERNGRRYLKIPLKTA